jgi:hypothetical protein
MQERQPGPGPHSGPVEVQAEALVFGEAGSEFIQSGRRLPQARRRRDRGHAHLGVVAPNQHMLEEWATRISGGIAGIF